MSGFFYGEDPQQDAQQRMAMALMGGNKQPGPFGGIGDALQMKAMSQRMAQNAYEKAPATQTALPFTGVNGTQQQTTLSDKLPYMGPKGLSGLFSFGGG